MKKTELKQRLQNEILILDGAMGTLLQPHIGGAPEAAVFDRPELLASIHAEYEKAGADIVSTNTFGANRIKLSEFGLAPKAREINAAAARLARKSVRKPTWIAGCMGPTGKLIFPLGDLDSEEAFAAFAEQAEALAEGGADLLLLETFGDLKEIKLAILAARDRTDLPIFASMTYGDDYKSLTGTDPETAANVLVSLGVDALGVNCSTGPEPMLEIVGRYTTNTACAVFVEPNAGIPSLDGNRISYQVTPAEMAAHAERFAEIGANVIGTCCGSTPEYTAALAASLKSRKPLSRNVERVLRLSSRVRTIEIGTGRPFCIIGERINPTNRPDLSAALEKGSVAPLLQEAHDQIHEGAHCLDVNVGIPGVEAQVMSRAVEAAEQTGAPLVIDSVNPAAVEAALRAAVGKVLINSVNADERSLGAILPLAKRYGSAVLCLAVDESGIPAEAEQRLEVLSKIIARAKKEGIGRENLICDCLTLTVSAQQKRAQTTLEAIRRVKKEFGLPCVLGVSNISYGLPDRSLLNATFLGMAMEAGLDAAIMNPGDPRMMDTVRAASVLTVRDRDSQSFIAVHGKKKAAPAESTIPGPGMRLHQAVLTGARDGIEDLVQELLGSGIGASEINTEVLVPAILEVGKRYDRKEVYLPQMILSAESMQRAVQALEPHFRKEDTRKRGTVVLCTVKGDVHDIGKNIVALFLKNHGYEVKDLGKDVTAERIVAASLETGADVVGLSALMTTTMGEMPSIIAALRESGNSRVRVVVGGAVVNKQYARSIGADGYAKDAASAVELIHSLVPEIHSKKSP